MEKREALNGVYFANLLQQTGDNIIYDKMNGFSIAQVYVRHS